MHKQYDKFLVYSFYRFVNIKNIKNVKQQLDNFFDGKLVRGTILIAHEGVNGTISGPVNILDEALKKIKNIIKIRKLETKINKTRFLPFNKMKVRLKKEIVAFGKSRLNVDKYRGDLVSPENWNQYISDKKIRLIDVRNEFEIDLGKFVKAERAQTKSFRDFPNSIKKLNLNKNSKIAMYCTGGIRCEKASAYMKSIGYKNVVQLEGGILKYLEYVKNFRKKSLWRGECFVFDKRVSVNKNLNKGKYFLCYGCRMPLSKQDIMHKNYKKGVHCHYCIDFKDKLQIKKSTTRQNQIDLYEKRNIDHTFKLIKSNK